MPTPNLQMDYLAEGQAGAYVTVNDALDKIDGALAGETPGGFTRLASVAVDLDLSADTTAAGLLPDRAIILGVSSLALTNITGPTSLDVGISGGSEFGGGLGVAQGSNNRGAVGPFAVYAPTDVTVTPNGGAVTSGTLRLVAHYIEIGVAP